VSDPHKGAKLSKATSRIKLAEGDLWDWYEKGHRVVVTTNIGWHPETARNNMGAGMALQAALRFPGLRRAQAARGEQALEAELVVGPEADGLDVWYGSICEQLGEETPVVAFPLEPRIILFPVKPLLYADNPERSWDQKGSYSLIMRSLLQLRSYEGKIALSYPGCGNGGLDEAKMGRLVENILGQDPDPERFTLVRFKSAHEATPGESLFRRWSSPV